MKLTQIAAVLLLISTAAFAGESCDPNTVLAMASEAKIVQVAQADARDFHDRVKSSSEKADGIEMSQYAEGRALKHGVFDTFKRMAYTNAFHDVWRQLEIDGD
jgi:hypothetical protein